MMSYELKIDPKKRTAGRFIGSVRKALIMAALDEKKTRGLTQQKVAECLGVNRSVVNKMLRGEVNLTLRSVAELAWAMGWQPKFSMSRIEKLDADNNQEIFPPYVVSHASKTAAAAVRTKVYNAGTVPSNHYHVAAE